MRSALLGAIYQVLLLAFDGKEFRSHSLIHLKHSYILLRTPRVCMYVYIYQPRVHAFQQLWSCAVKSPADRTTGYSCAVLGNVMRKRPQCQAHNSLKHCFLH